jgi:glycosyltransferase involved in cell wall biosynthesis
MNNNYPLVTIITVCYNSEKTIKDTIESVLNQTYMNIEYILVDGASSDDTLDIIKSYEEKFKEKGMIYRWISEPDKGIYDAMNKGIDMASGEWINFMNSGDYFIEKNIIEDIVNVAIKEGIEILYGNILRGERISKRKIKSTWQLAYTTICHQAIFAHKKCFYENKFNLKYKWLADYEWLIKCFKNKNLKKKYVNEIIAYFDPTNDRGSKNMHLERVKERKEIGKKYFKGLSKLLFYIIQTRLEIKFNFFYNQK